VNTVAAGEKRKRRDGAADGEEWKEDGGGALVGKQKNNSNLELFSLTTNFKINRKCSLKIGFKDFRNGFLNKNIVESVLLKPILVGRFLEPVIEITGFKWIDFRTGFQQIRF
jgi:hypothetical protein